MAFPTQAGTAASGGDAGNATTRTLGMPGSVAVGDGLLACVSHDLGTGGLAIGASSTAGWVELLDLAGPATAFTGGIYWMPSSPTTTPRLDIDSASERMSWVVWRITGQHTTTTPTLTTATGTSSTPNPPLHTPAGGAQDYLWCAIELHDTNAGVATSGPTNYTSLTTAGAASAGRVGIAFRQVNAASENPGAGATETFTIGAPTSDEWIAATLSIYPTGGTPVSDSMLFERRTPRRRMLQRL